MKNQLSAVAVQGAVAGTESSLPNSILAQINKTLRFTGLQAKKAFFFSIVLFNLLSSSLIAQNSDTLDVDTFGFLILSPVKVLAPYESATVTILVGKSGNQVDGATDIDIELELDKEVLFPSAPALDLSNSWFFDTTSLDTTVSLDSANRKIAIAGHRSVATSGYGQLYELTLVAGPNGIEANRMVKGGGGLVIVSDIGFKTSPIQENLSQEAPEATLFPNPCHNMVNFDWQDNRPTSVTFYTTSGQVAATLSQNQIALGTYATHSLSEGLYKVVMVYENQAHHTQTLIVN